MKRAKLPKVTKRLAVACLLASVTVTTLQDLGSSEKQEHPRGEMGWPQFRGPQASGQLPTEVPLQWDSATGKSIAWKVKIPGLGHASPIVWGNRVFLATAVPEDDAEADVATGWLGGTGKAVEEPGPWTWELHCYDLHSGEQLWRRVAVKRQPTIKRHLKATHANCTPATDGQSVVAFFGSEGLYCYDMLGELRWKKEVGRLHSGPYDAKELEWGFASSPVIAQGMVILQCDCLNTGFLAAFRLSDGEQVWRAPRRDVATWSTPTVVRWQDRQQVVCNGFREMAGYDLRNGQRLWWLSGGGDVPVPTPIFAGERIVLTNAHGRSPIYAIDPLATGELTPGASTEDQGEPQEKPKPEEPKPQSSNTDDSDSTKRAARSGQGLLWHDRRDGSYMPTPIAVGHRLFTCNDNGRLSVRRLSDGEILSRQRIGDGANFTASAVATAQHVFYFDEAGEAFVVSIADEPEVLFRNSLGEPVLATPALTQNQILVRTLRHLICIRTPAAP